MTDSSGPTEPTLSGPLLVDTTLAGELAERLVGWYLFPVEGKTPKTSWQSNAATGRDNVESLWRRFAGFNEDGTDAFTGVGVACDPSGIFVLDEDRDWRSEELSPGTDWQTWVSALDSGHSLVLPSSNRGRPHFYFLQPSDGLGKVAERVWHGGDIKSKGFVVLAAAGPLYQPSASGGGLWTPADVFEAITPLADLIGRRRVFDSNDPQAQGYSHRVTKEEFVTWFEQPPGEHFGGRLISEEYENFFISQIKEKLRNSVTNDGVSRRSACLNIVHMAVIESYQGLYSLKAAYDAIEDEYEELRSHGPGDTSGDKGWNQRRADDFRSMWETEIAKPDALKAAEASYEELITRLNSSGTKLEISKEDRETDSECMDIILAAEQASNAPTPTPSTSVLTPAHASTASSTLATTQSTEASNDDDDDDDDNLPWDEVGVVDPPVKPEVVSDRKTVVSPVNLGDFAKRGVLWDLASGLIGQHELPHEALLITMIGWAGCVLGSVGAGYMPIGEDRHGPELCVCMVGTSAISHKSGTVNFGHMVFDEWVDPMETGVGAPGQGSGFFREVSGIESGQAFIEIWPNAADIAGGEGIGRAVMMVETELTTMWKKAARKGSTIPEEIRKAWDGHMLAVRGVRAGNHRVQPQNYRFSAVGATIHTLAAHTIRESGADISGDANRWLWCWGQEVPHPVKGGKSFSDHILVEAARNQVRGLIKSVEQARQQGWWPGSAVGPGGIPIVEFAEPKVWWTPEADQAWLGDKGSPTEGKGVYADLCQEISSNATGSSVVVALKGRGAQQVMRIAIGYEMLKAGEGWAGLVRNTVAPDGMSWCISLEALNWASDVWRFCADTVEHIFSSTTGNEKVDELVSAIREIGRDQGKEFKGYVLKTDVVGNGFSKNTLSALVAQAESQGAVWTANRKTNSGRGQPRVVVGLAKWKMPPDVVRRKRPIN